MRFALAAVAAFALLAWDIGRNNGHYTRQLHDSLDDITSHPSTGRERQGEISLVTRENA